MRADGFMPSETDHEEALLAVVCMSASTRVSPLRRGHDK
jgi:hypothetical protein